MSALPKGELLSLLNSALLALRPRSLCHRLPFACSSGIFATRAPLLHATHAPARSTPDGLVGSRCARRAYRRPDARGGHRDCRASVVGPHRSDDDDGAGENHSLAGDVRCGCKRQLRSCSATTTGMYLDRLLWTRPLLEKKPGKPAREWTWRPGGTEVEGARYFFSSVATAWWLRPGSCPGYS